MFLIFKLSLDGSTHYFFWIVIVTIGIRNRFKARNGPIGSWWWLLPVLGCVNVTRIVNLCLICDDIHFSVWIVGVWKYCCIRQWWVLVIYQITVTVLLQEGSVAFLLHLNAESVYSDVSNNTKVTGGLTPSFCSFDSTSYDSAMASSWYFCGVQNCRI
jgi:hypothetical protein